MGIVLAMMLLGVLGPLLIGTDEVSGTDDSDRIEGRDGAETLQGGGGADLLLAAMGDDVVSGGGGSDWIFAGDGDDIIAGDADGDVILPGAGADRVDGGNGDDFIEAANLVDLDALNASLRTARSFADIRFDYDFAAKPDAGDSVQGGGGDDTILAGPDDTISGGAGADQIATGDWGRNAPPATVTDFDPDADMLTYTYRVGTAAPVLTTQTDPASGDVTVLANGQAAVILRNLPQGFDPGRITIRLWRDAA